MSARKSRAQIWGEAIQAVRLGNGLSQDEFAKMVDVSRQTVSNWETFKNEPQPEQIRKLHELFPEELPEDRPAQPDFETLHRANLQGRSIEIEALMAYALERQRLLTAALGAMNAPEGQGYHLTPAQQRERVLRVAEHDPAQAYGAGGTDPTPAPAKPQRRPGKATG